MLLVIDNFDSFTYNLVQYFGEMGAEMEIRRNDQVTLEEIAVALAAMGASVDYVTIFDEPTPRELVARVLPDVLVKGADWAIDDVVGRKEVEAAGGRVISISLAAGYSTTRLVEKIRKAASVPDDGSADSHT